MNEHEWKGLTAQPVIAERELAYAGSTAAVTIRIHAPEPRVPFRGYEWRCGYSVSGLPSVPAFYDSDVPGPGEVWIAEGQDSFQALAQAFAEIRALLDRVEEEFHLELVWPVMADWGHQVPRQVSQSYGRAFEKRVLDVMGSAERQLIAERMPNPYAWDDPRHPSQRIRRLKDSGGPAHGTSEQ